MIFFTLCVCCYVFICVCSDFCYVLVLPCFTCVKVVCSLYVCVGFCNFTYDVMLYCCPKWYDVLLCYVLCVTCSWFLLYVVGVFIVNVPSIVFVVVVCLNLLCWLFPEILFVKVACSFINFILRLYVLILILSHVRMLSHVLILILSHVLI